MTTQWSGAVVVVVGGARGIGLAVVRGAAAKGARTVVIDRDAAAVERLAREGVAQAVHEVDVLEEPRLSATLGGLDRIDHVYVAAGSTKLSSILDGRLEDQLGPLDVRLRGSAHVLRACVPRMRGGSITLTGGVSTDRPVPGAWVSSVATAATEQLARAMALELAPIRVNAIAPGWTDTPMWDDVLGPRKAEVFAEVAAQQPIKRLATPEEVAQAVLFLMQNGSITGEILHVDGGRRLT